MKIFWRVVGVLFIAAVMIHLWVRFMDRNLTRDRRVQTETNKTQKLITIKEIRLALEAEQKKEIDTYARTEKENIARIPVERGIFYYLRSLPR